jgi:hypothetical protein
VKETSVSIRHTSGLRAKMDDLIQSFELVKQSWGTLSTVIANLENRQVQMVDFLKQIYGEPSENKRGITVHQNRTEAIFKRLYRERSLTGRPAMDSSFTVSAWEAFNAIQGFVQHDAQAKTGFKGEFDRILRASNDQAVLKAENIVMGLLAA